MEKQNNKISFASQTAKDAYEDLPNDPKAAHDEAWGTLDDGVDISGADYDEDVAEQIEIEKFGRSMPEVLENTDQSSSI